MYAKLVIYVMSALLGSSQRLGFGRFHSGRAGYFAAFGSLFVSFSLHVIGALLLMPLVAHDLAHKFLRRYNQCLEAQSSFDTCPKCLEFGHRSVKH
jgi:hypothetical protein